jgi:chromosome segregation ATPase
MLLDARLRRLTTYLYVQDLLPGAAVLEVGGDGGQEVLRARGAQSVRAVTAGELATLPAGSFDVAFALENEPQALRATVQAAKEALKPTGTLVLAVPSRDRPGARAGLSYYELLDLLEPLFPSVKMMGQAPFVGATLVEYGVTDPDPVLDGTLVPKGERVEWYVAVAGPGKPLSRGYGVMQVPVSDVAALPSERRVAPQPEPKKPAPPVPVAPQPAKPVEKVLSDEELKSQLGAAQKGKAELQEFVLELKRQLAERDAYVAELDGERRELSRLREAARLAEARSQRAEAAERETRKRLAEAEGTILRLRAGGPALATGAAATAATATGEPATAVSTDVAALQAELEKWKQKESDARAEAWKALKQRSEAESQAAEVREDTVRKLKDARKLASVELTRATEEAMKKAVTLKEELTRTERERKELLAEVKRLQQELEAARAAIVVPPVEAPAGGAPTAGAAGDELRGRVAALERELVNADAIAAADRARSAQLLADMERESQERADSAVRLRHALRDREREVAELRHELSERDARLTALEQRTPPSDEIERIEAELTTARARLGAVMQELARKEAQVERAAAAAAHERTRAERMMAGERHALEALGQARTRAGEAERQLDVARERLGRLELELRGEAERVGALEQAVRRAVESARNGYGGAT